jgi:hypothetical protein
MTQRGNSKEQVPVQVISGGGETTAGTRGPLWMIAPLVILLVAIVGSLTIFSHGPVEQPPVTTTSEPQLLSQQAPVIVDATRTAGPNVDVGWTRAELDPGVRLGGLAASGSGFVAVGFDSDGPALWRSDTGAIWERGDLLESPPGADASELTAPPWGITPPSFIAWRDSTVLFGSDGERTAVWIEGRFQGYTDVFTDLVPSVVIAGPNLLAEGLSLPGGGRTAESDQFDQIWWLSADGVDWEQTEPVGLPETGVVKPIAWADGFYYAAHYCTPEMCPANLFRSADGVSWEQADVGPPSPTASAGGFVNRVASIGDGLIAIGAVDAGTRWDPAFWTSTDGSVWSYVPPGEEFETRSTTLQLALVGDGVAAIDVNGVDYELTKGSVISTDAGPMTLRSINGDSVRLSTKSHDTVLDAGETYRLVTTPSILNIAASGEIVAIQGTLSTSIAGRDDGGFAVPAIWLSGDQGRTWSLSALNTAGETWIESSAVSSSSVVLAGSDLGTVQVWYRQLGRE